MKDVVLWLLAFLATWIVLLVVVTTLMRWRLQRRNRVSPAVKSPAPITWLWSPRPPARMHRRLQLAVAEIQLAPSRRSPLSGPASVDDMRRELEYQAVELDHHLVIAARHPRRQRRLLVRSLDEQIADVEQLSVRLSRLSGRPPGTPASGWDATREPPDLLADIGHQLDLLDAAQEELTAIERAAGLVDVDALLAPTTEPVAGPLVIPPEEPPPPARR